MAFPFTHLCVAFHITKKLNLNIQEKADFLLGSIAPDAIHYRKSFLGAEMKNIGAAKKITHLCPVSDEKWGHVTENDKWSDCVKDFLKPYNSNYFAYGYAVHVLTDIQNNKSIWTEFRLTFPEEAAKGYTSGYYDDLKKIDSNLFWGLDCSSDILETLAKATSQELYGLVSLEEVDAIKNNIVHEHFKDSVEDLNYKYKFISLDQTINFIHDTADYILNLKWQ